ncbi:hypothetical protein C8J57DRAFT_674548 [Mycena rebaudengoi]|nr:hypothetical protein C8J57DRAFT_674548 [Mycena rebaudengoi]
MSPLTAVASSLSGWNGTPPSPVTPIAPQPMRLNPPNWLASPMNDATYDSSPDFDPTDPMTPLASEFQWPEPSMQYAFEKLSTQCAFETESSAESSSSQARLNFNYAPQADMMAEYARAEALQEYEMGLQERVLMADAPDFGLFALETTIDEYQY